MASPPANQTPAKDKDKDDDNCSFSYFRKTVTLCDWWLVKAEKDYKGKRLAVAGFCLRELQALRMFHSAPISIRYDTFTLQTADGITIILQGFINKTRSLENGFPDEVFSHFLFGFPHYWEEYAKKFLDDHIDIENNFDCRKLTTNPAITGSKESSPISAWNKPVITCKDKHHSACVENCCHALSIVVSKEPDMQISPTQLNSSVQEKSDAIVHSILQVDYIEDKENDSVSQDECCPSVLKGRLDKNFKHKDNNASEDNLTSSTHDSNSMTLMTVEIASQVEPAEYHPLGSTATVDDSESSKEMKNGLQGVLKTKISASSRRMTVINDVSVDFPSPKVSNGNINVPIVNSLVCPRTSVVVLALSSNKWRMSKHKQTVKEENKGALHMETTNFSIASPSQSLEAVSSSADDSIIDEGSKPRSPTVGDSNVLKHLKDHVKDSMLCYTFQSGEEANVTPSNSQSKISDSMRVLKDKRKQRSVSGCSAKGVARGLKSDHIDQFDRNKLNGDSFKSVASAKKVNLIEKMLGASRSLKNTSGISTHKPNDRQRGGEVAGSSRKKTKRKISFGVHGSPQTLERKEKICIRSPESLSLKRSRSGRLLLPTLDFWRNQIPVYDVNRNVTGIQEEFDTEKPYRGSKSKPRRKRSS